MILYLYNTFLILYEGSFLPEVLSLCEGSACRTALVQSLLVEPRRSHWCRATDLARYRITIISLSEGIPDILHTKQFHHPHVQNYKSVSKAITNDQKPNGLQALFVWEERGEKEKGGRKSLSFLYLVKSREVFGGAMNSPPRSTLLFLEQKIVKENTIN